MAEKVALPQVNYVSDNPEQDWENFQNAMGHILKGSKADKVENVSGLETSGKTSTERRIDIKAQDNK